MLFDAAEVKSESDGSPEKSRCPSEGVEAVEASSSVGTASNTQQEGQSNQLPAGLNMCYVVIIMSENHMSMLAVLHQNNIGTGHSIILPSLWLLLLIHAKLETELISALAQSCVYVCMCISVVGLFMLSSQPNCVSLAWRQVYGRLSRFPVQQTVSRFPVQQTVHNKTL